MTPWRRAFPIGSAAIVVVSIVSALYRPPLGFLDGTYSLSLYPSLQNAVTSATNRIPFALGSLFVIAVVIAVAAIWFSALHTSRAWASWIRALTNTLALGGILYVWFLFSWGWNYLRPSVATTLHYAPERVNGAELQRLERSMVDALNAASVAAHAVHARGEPNVAELLAAQDRALSAIGAERHIVQTRPKQWLLDPYFNAVGISGMFFPFTFETYIASDVLWFEYPFTIEHEWSHLAGVARESDANLVAAIATLSSDDPNIRYSGLLAVYGGMPRGPADRRLLPQVFADYEAIRVRDRTRINPFASRVAWTTYDRYLKTQHVQRGVLSYSDYVRLLLGTAAGRTALGHAIGRRV